ncbi:MAG: S8 family serine peptidase [Anaerolineaceae bacterium]|nr:S8 family serine peptidase [Anaerolineaceae bacterium]
MKKYAALFLVLTFFLLTLLLSGGVSGQDAGSGVTLHLIRSRDSLAIYNPSDVPVSLMGLELRTVTQSISPVSNFQALSLNGGMASPKTCYIYVLFETAEPTPSTCLPSPVIRVIPRTDVFWYDFVANSPQAIAIQLNGQSIGQPCAGNIADCAFFWTPLPTPAPTPTQTPIPTSVISINENGFSNLGEIQPDSLENILAQTGIQAWVTAGWVGAGQRIGVLDHHFGDMANLPFPVVTKDALADYNTDNLTSGRDVLEVIHGVAPGAELFACRYATYDEFTSCVDWLVAQHVTVISHAAGAPVLRLDESSGWSQKVNETAERNIVWVEAAGNFAGARFEQFFTDDNENLLHEFERINRYRVEGYNEVLAFAPIGHYSGTVMLAWESTSDSPVDLDLVITDPQTGERIADSVQSATAEADGTGIEYAVFDMQDGFGIQVRNVSGHPVDSLFSLYVEYASVTGSEQDDSITAPGDSPQALTVAVMQGSHIAPYSSQGPAGAEIKPDLAARGEIQLAGGRLFIGSSASAAVVSGFAALVREANPNFGQEEVQSFILDFATGDDSEFRGRDPVYGEGFLSAPTPVPTLTYTPSQEVRETGGAVTPTATPIANAADQPMAIVRESSINLRRGPGTAYEVADYAYLGERFTIISRAYRWYLVEDADGQLFWLAASVVDVENLPETLLPPVTVPPAPTQPPPPSTPTFEPSPPRPLDAPESPGNVRIVPTRRPRPAGAVTPLVTATPNGTATQGVITTATRYAANLTATATLWTPTVDLTRMSATPTPTVTPSPTNTIGPAIGGQSAATNTPVPTLAPATCVPTKPASWSGWVAYTIRSGDTLGQLAVDTGTSVAAIMTANCLPSSNIIAGNTLYLPKQPPAPPPTSPPSPITPGDPTATPCTGEGCTQPPPASCPAPGITGASSGNGWQYTVSGYASSRPSATLRDWVTPTPNNYDYSGNVSFDGCNWSVTVQLGTDATNPPADCGKTFTVITAVGQIGVTKTSCSPPG